MTNFEKIAASRETLGAFLGSLPVPDGPWDQAFQERFCAGCGREDCSACKHPVERNNPTWWLGLEAKG